MIADTKKETKNRMERTIEALRSELAKLRTGKASPALLDGVTVEYYGSKVPVRQVANISAPEPRLIVIQPWERNMLAEIERAILKSDLGLNPTNDGIVIRIPIPQLTEERRHSLVKIAKKVGEDGKIVIRNIRRDANEQLKNLKKQNEISEDELFKCQSEVQKITDDYIKKSDAIFSAKEKEIMEI